MYIYTIYTFFRVRQPVQEGVAINSGVTSRGKPKKGRRLVSRAPLFIHIYSDE